MTNKEKRQIKHYISLFYPKAPKGKSNEFISVSYQLLRAKFKKDFVCTRKILLEKYVKV